MITIPLVNLMRISIYYHIILVIGDSVLLGVFEIGYGVLDVFGVEKNILECRSDE